MLILNLAAPPTSGCQSFLHDVNMSALNNVRITGLVATFVQARAAARGASGV
jgi:hypothetical protein